MQVLTYKHTHTHTIIYTLHILLGHGDHDNGDDDSSRFFSAEIAPAAEPKPLKPVKDRIDAVMGRPC